jgi:hypothetical protein
MRTDDREKLRKIAIELVNELETIVVGLASRDP